MTKDFKKTPLTPTSCNESVYRSCPQVSFRPSALYKYLYKQGATGQKPAKFKGHTARWTAFDADVQRVLHHPVVGQLLKTTLDSLQVANAMMDGMSAHGQRALFDKLKTPSRLR